MALLNDKGELSKGFEILVRQILKMMNFDPEVTLSQISGIHELLKRHTEQQAEMLAILKRIDNGQSQQLGNGGAGGNGDLADGSHG